MLDEEDGEVVVEVIGVEAGHREAVGSVQLSLEVASAVEVVDGLVVEVSLEAAEDLAVEEAAGRGKKVGSRQFNNRQTLTLKSLALVYCLLPTAYCYLSTRH